MIRVYVWFDDRPVLCKHCRYPDSGEIYLSRHGEEALCFFVLRRLGAGTLFLYWMVDAFLCQVFEPAKPEELVRSQDWEATGLASS